MTVIGEMPFLITNQPQTRHLGTDLAMRDDEEVLSTSDIRELASHTPPPVHIERIGNIVFALYRAKRLHDHAWEHPVLRRLVVEARKTYKVYGDDIPEINTYDLKSAIYLVRVTYLMHAEKYSFPVEEWSSMRFVPAMGEPLRTEDLDFFVYAKKREKTPVINIMSECFTFFRGKSEEEILSMIATQSRLCAIRPYALKKSDEEIFFTYIKKTAVARKNHYVPICFALMNRQFLDDCQKEDEPIKLLTSQIHTYLSDTVLSLSLPSGTQKLPFTNAHTYIDGVNPHAIRIDREKPGVYAYQYPGYFLNVHDLARTFKELLSEKFISREALSPYLVSGVEFGAMFYHPHIKHFQKMGTLLTMKGKIDGSNITGEQLRKILNHRVSDGPTWRLLDIQIWRQGVTDFLSVAQKHFNRIDSS